MQGELRVMNRHGDSAVKWDTDQPSTVKDAEVEFDRLVKDHRYLAFVPTEKAGQKTGRQIKQFDPEASQILVTPPLAGG